MVDQILSLQKAGGNQLVASMLADAEAGVSSRSSSGVKKRCFGQMCKGPALRVRAQAISAAKMAPVLENGGVLGKGIELTWQDSLWWWRNANGMTLTIDGRILDVWNIFGEFAAPTPLDDLKVHGHVTTNPDNGRIYDGTFEFEPRVMDGAWYNLKVQMRNRLNLTAIQEAGPGTPFEIQYRYEDSFFE